MTEKEKMLSGMIYDPSDSELSNIRREAHNLCLDYNKLYEDDPKRKEIIDKLFPHNNGVYLQGPIYFDYGLFTSFGKNCYANFNLTILDCAPVDIGDDVFIGTSVSIVTPVHPMLYDERKLYEKADGVMTDKEYAKPIKIMNGVWICSNSTITGGVTIGEGSVIGAGSVVVNDIPPYTLAAGNPCKPIRKIDKSESIYLKKKLFEQI